MSTLAFQSSFERSLSTNDWHADLQREGFQTFTQAGFPTTKDEDWKHTSLAKVKSQTFGAVSKPGTPENLPKATGPRVIFVDGVFHAIDGEAVEGLQLLTLAQFITQHPEKARNTLGHVAKLNGPGRGLIGLNQALSRDGVVLLVSQALQTPVEWLFISTEHSAGCQSFLRHLIVAEPGSECTVLERHSSDASIRWSHHVTEVFLGQNATVHQIKIQEEGAQTFHTASIEIRQKRDSHYSARAFCLGGAIGRTELRVKLEEPGSHCDLKGAYLGKGTEHRDLLTYVEHATTHSSSSQVFKGILNDKAVGVFNGMVHVRPDAQQTNAHQSNKNLLLSNDAKVHSRPQLEIHADDVKCSHGSTVGALDPNALFFLRSRGIGHMAAKALLTNAFASDVIETVRLAPVRDELQATVADWMTP